MSPKLFVVFTLIILATIAVIVLYNHQRSKNEDTEDPDSSKKKDDEYCSDLTHREMYLDNGSSIAEWRCAICNKKVQDF